MKKYVFILFALTLFLSCQQVNKTESNTATSDTDMDYESIARVKEMYHRFPTPDEMLSIINKNKKEYSKNLVNSAKHSDQYLDSKTQALNLGVYMADLAYLSIHEQHNESMEYFEALYEISDKLRISSAFKRTFLRRIQDNITNSDSLKALSEEAFDNLSTYLESNHNEKVFVLISIGGFVETLYLSCQITEEYDQKSDMVQKIADQKYVLENVIQYAQYYKDDAAVNSAIEQLQPLLDLYRSLEIQKSETSVNKLEDGKLVISGGDKLLITEEQFAELKEKTTAIRTSIVEL